MSSNHLTQKQKNICYLIDGIAFILLGIFLILSATELLKVDFKSIILFAILLFFGLAMIANSFVQHNSMLLWIGTLLFVCALAGFFVNCTEAITYRKIYPLFIASPAIASLVSMILASEHKMHLFSAVFFGVIAVLFAFESAGLVSIKIIIPIAFILVGIIIIISVLFTKGEKNER